MSARERAKESIKRAAKLGGVDEGQLARLTSKLRVEPKKKKATIAGRKVSDGVIRKGLPRRSSRRLTRLVASRSSPRRPRKRRLTHRLDRG